ncbi:alpha/beta hydrolase [Pseudonocardia zijingensis]
MDLDGTFSWEGRRIAWGRAGSGPAVVFCHGTPWSSWLWRPFAEALSTEFTVYLWDMPGYGRSSKDAGHTVDFEAQAAAFTALLDHWGLDRPHVVAHDYGGAVSLRAHLVHGVAYASLLLTDVVAIPPAGSPFFRLVQQHPDVLSRVPPYIHEALVRAYIADASHRELREDDLAALVTPWLGEEGQPAFYRQIAAYDERYLVENEALLGRIDIPVNVVWGVEDTWIPITTGERLAAAIPGAGFTRVEGAGHLIQLDTPVVLATALRTWLAARLSPPAGPA